MFDEQPLNPTLGAGSPPSNLPVVEPEDIFGDEAGSAPLSAVPQSASSPVAPSAVDAGLLKPKIMPSAPVVHTAPPAEMMRSREDIKEPKTAKRVMIIILILIGVAVLVGIIWLVFGALTRSMTSPPAASAPPADEASPPPPEAGLPVVEEADTSADDAILFGELIDADGDNLDQSREATIGTDPNNWDTDGDGLNDGDEVIIWKTDPTRADTDGDTYSDGSEVQNGYSPTGPGKLFQPPSGA